MANAPHTFKIAISGLEGAAIIGQTRHSLDAEEIRAINLRIRMEPDQLMQPSNTVIFTATAVEKPALRASAESRFLKPR